MHELQRMKVGAHEGTSPCNKSRGQVPSCELAIVAPKCSRRDQTLVIATGPTISNQFEFNGDTSLRFVLQNASCDQATFWIVIRKD